MLARQIVIKMYNYHAFLSQDPYNILNKTRHDMDHGTIFQRLIKTGRQFGFTCITPGNAYLVPAVAQFLTKCRELHGQRPDGFGPRFHSKVDAAAKSL